MSLVDGRNTVAGVTCKSHYIEGSTPSASAKKGCFGILFLFNTFELFPSHVFLLNNSPRFGDVDSKPMASEVRFYYHFHKFAMMVWMSANIHEAILYGVFVYVCRC